MDTLDVVVHHDSRRLFLFKTYGRMITICNLLFKCPNSLEFSRVALTSVQTFSRPAVSMPTPSMRTETRILQRIMMWLHES